MGKLSADSQKIVIPFFLETLIQFSTVCPRNINLWNALTQTKKTLAL